MEVTSKSSQPAGSPAGFVTEPSGAAAKSPPGVTHLTVPSRSYQVAPSPVHCVRPVPSFQLLVTLCALTVAAFDIAVVCHIESLALLIVAPDGMSLRSNSSSGRVSLVELGPTNIFSSAP